MKSVLIPSKGDAVFRSNVHWMSALDAQSSARANAKLMLDDPEVESVEIVILQHNEALKGLGEILRKGAL